MAIFCRAPYVFEIKTSSNLYCDGELASEQLGDIDINPNALAHLGLIKILLELWFNPCL